MASMLHRRPPASPLLLPAALVVQVRGISSSVEELAHIMQHSESRALVVQDAATLDKLLPALRGDGAAAPPPVRFVVVLWGQPSQGAAAALGAAVHTYESVLARGAQQVRGAVKSGVGPHWPCGVQAWCGHVGSLCGPPATSLRLAAVLSPAGVPTCGGGL